MGEERLNARNIWSIIGARKYWVSSPSLCLGLWLLHLPFCLIWIHYKPALYGQINHPEAGHSPWMSFHIVGVRGRAHPGLGQSGSSGGVPSQLLSSRLSPCSWDGFLGFRPGFHSSFWGTVWGGAWGSVGTPWGNKTIVTEWIKMLKRHTTLQKTFLWSLYFSSLSIFWALGKPSKKYLSVYITQWFRSCFMLRLHIFRFLLNIIFLGIISAKSRSFPCSLHNN